MAGCGIFPGGTFIHFPVSGQRLLGTSCTGNRCQATYTQRLQKRNIDTAYSLRKMTQSITACISILRCIRQFTYTQTIQNHHNYTFYSHKLNSLSSGMSFFINITQFTFCKLCIYLCSRNICMSQHFLYRT